MIDVGLDAVCASSRSGRGRADGADRRVAERAHVAWALKQGAEEAGDAVGRLEDDPIEAVDVGGGPIHGLRIVRRSEAERRRFDRLAAQVLDAIDEFLCLFVRSGDDDPPPEERPLVEPAQVVAERGDLADHENRDVRSRIGRQPVEQFGEGARRGLLARQRAAPHERRRRVGGRAMVDERAKNLGRQPRIGVADEGAIERDERRPIDVRHGVRVAFRLRPRTQHDESSPPG